jgi:hypothetical protein
MAGDKKFYVNEQRRCKMTEDPNNPFNDPDVDAYKDFEGNLILPDENPPYADFDEEYKDLLD